MTRTRIAAATGVVLAGALALSLGLSGKADAAGDGRYTMQPVEGGFLRLDTRTGAVAICKGNGEWRCEPVADTQAGLEREIAELRVENDFLRSQVRALGAEPVEPSEEEVEARLDLPTDEELDAAVEVMSKVADRFGRMMKIMRDEIEGLGDDMAGTPDGETEEAAPAE